MTRYEFLARAHEIIKPKVYLEIGVQYGGSLALAEAADLAIGVDPHPSLVLQHERPNAQVFAMRSDAFFRAIGPDGGMRVGGLDPGVDMAFIDGSHLFEDALADFIAIERLLAGPRSVVFFDDVLPYNQEIAARTQPPGDWTGDVWKVVEILESYATHLSMELIDVEPTGLLMVWSEYWPLSMTWGDVEMRPWGRIELERDHEKIVEEWGVGLVVPDEYINRTHAMSAQEALGILSELLTEERA